MNLVSFTVIELKFGEVHSLMLEPESDPNQEENEDDLIAVGKSTP